MKCPKGDYATDMDAFRCPRCGAILKKYGVATEETKNRLQKEDEQYFNAYKEKFIK